MTTNPVGLASFSNLTPEESKENTPVLPHHIFEKALPPVTSAQPLGEVTQLMNVISENKEQHEDHLIEVKQLFWSNGNTYEGETTLNDLPHGYGTLVYNTGIRYVGQFHEGKYHGQGTLIIPNEGKYVGEFRDGLFDGSGTFYYSEGDIYTGSYVKGARQCGFLQYKNQGGSYFGEYKNDERHGQGILRSPEGDVYVGGFEDGLYSGYGKVTFADGSPSIEGWFKKGLL